MSTTVVKGGVDLLDKDERVQNVDREAAEASEPLNLRTSDVLDIAIAEIIKKSPGGHVEGVQYSRPVQYSSIPEEITFDRHYFDAGLDLLVDFFSTPMTDAQKEELAKEIAGKRKFARTLKKKYLAIVGSATYEEIAEAIS